MQILATSLLLIECTLILSVYSQCDVILPKCISCQGFTSTDACVLSADNNAVECQLPYPSSECSLRACSSPFDTCMTSWTRTDEAGPWRITSGCLSLNAGDSPCNYDGTCEHTFDMSDPIPSTLATGTFFCRCYEDSCNQNFSVDISVYSQPVTTSITLTPTPTVEIDEHDCIECVNVNPICTLSEDNRTLECSFDDDCANNIVRCAPTETCSATWARQDASSPWVGNAGCFGGRSDFVSDQPTCEVNENFFKEPIERPIPNSVETGSFICACLGGLCNREFRIDLNDFASSTTITMSRLSPTSSANPVDFSTTRTSTMIPTPSANSTGTRVGQRSDVNTDGLTGDDIIAISVSLTVAFCLVVFAVLIIGFCIYTRRPPKVGQTEWNENEGGFKEGLSQLPVEPLEIVGSGRFGTVWKAKLHEEIVACKILSFKEAKSWENERMLYCLPSTAHPNILEYIGSEQKGQGYEAQYLMVLKYYPLGSLSSYLKGHTLSWNQACNFINSALAGVAHLHAESYYNFEGVSQVKSPIVHRDIKSSNFLVKSDSGECVLSDLGLSLQLNPNMDVSELASIGQVGTYRYMSPEALDASINLHDPESFKQIDMYALALVLWEIGSRCAAHEGDAVPEYSLPFSREVGQRANPMLDTMRTIVVHGRKRPKIPESWKTHEGLSVLAETIPECWDQDPEARLTAAGVLGRMEEALEIKGPNQQKVKVLRAQAKSTSSCESGSCEQTISSVSSKTYSTTEVTVEANEEANSTNNSSSNSESNSNEEATVEVSEVDVHYANMAEEVTVDASEVQ